MRIRTIIIMVLLLSACSGSCSGSGDEAAAPATVSAAGDGAAGATSTTSPPPTTDPVPTTSSTTTATSTTTTRPAPTSSSTRPRATSSTTRPPTTRAPSRPPTVSITSPGGAQRYQATYDAAAGNFGAVVPLAASAVDPDGDAVAIEWYSDLHGFLGTGTSLAARLRVFGDASQPVITAVATDGTGASGRASRQIIIWIVSDQ